MELTDIKIDIKIISGGTFVANETGKYKTLDWFEYKQNGIIGVGIMWSALFGDVNFFFDIDETPSLPEFGLKEFFYEKRQIFVDKPLIEQINRGNVSLGYFLTETKKGVVEKMTLYQATAMQVENYLINAIVKLKQQI